MLSVAKVVESVATARQVALAVAIKIVLYVVPSPVLEWLKKLIKMQNYGVLLLGLYTVETEHCKMNKEYKQLKKNNLHIYKIFIEHMSINM